MNKNKNFIEFFLDATYKIIPKKYKGYKLLTIASTNNCVGKENKPYFVAFVFSLLINLIIDCYITIQIFIFTPTENVGNYLLENMYFRFIYGGIVFIISLFFIFPVSYLIYMQYKNKYSHKEV